MRLKSLIGLPVLILIAATGVEAQSLRNVAGPAELPPASYSGLQYIDSKGCVFVRAGYGSNVVWVPRVKRDRSLYCGQTPTFAAVVAETEAAPAAVPQARAQSPAPVVVAVPARVVAAPAAAAAPVMRQAQSAIPKGFKAAWKDGRLNPDRGPRTAEGDAQMATVWTQTVPRRLLLEAPTTPAPANARAILSTRSPAAATAIAGAYVQLGTYGQPSNARAAAGWLGTVGLPVQLRDTRLGGKPVQVVMAGPFADGQALARALATVRAGGYGDAFIKR